MDEFDVGNIIPVFVLGTLSFCSAGGFRALPDKLETKEFGMQNLRSLYMHLALIAMTLRLASAITSLAMKPVTVTCRQ